MDLLKKLPQKFEPIKRDKEFQSFLKRIESTLVKLETENKALKKQVSKYKKEASKDALTDMYTRKYFEERAQQEIHRFYRYGIPFAIAFLDLDHFKKINDTYGHQVGDIVLVEFSKAILDTIRVNDFACRYGGEEFVVLFSGATSQNALSALKRIKNTFMSSEQLKEKNITVTFSAGLGSYSDELGDLYALIEHCDKKLYEAKESGRDRFLI